ncbi:MAG: serine/threonine protein kinase [Myxococcales bacterium]|nr:serine/threonine protein kinase [Myxococcales bacterium]
MSVRPQPFDVDPTVPVGIDAPTSGGRPALSLAPEGLDEATGRDDDRGDPDDDEGTGIPRPLPARKPWMPPDFSGRVLGKRYRILRMLGFGGMATVYEAEHVTIEKRVAVKILNPDYAEDPEIASRFLLEAKTASKLRHEHIIDITDFGDSDGSVWFVMELLEGEDLAATLLENGPLHYPRVINIARQICSALAAAHAIRVIHRDIKPANCFRITRGGNSDFIKVLDFGIAKIANPNERDSQRTTGTPLGTPGYMALELLKGEDYDHRVDIYALGVLMYKLLTNKMPFPALNAYGTLARQLDGEPAPLREAAPDREIPEILADLIIKALARDPEHRFQSATALLEALDDVERELHRESPLSRDPLSWGARERIAPSAPTVIAPPPASLVESGASEAAALSAAGVAAVAAEPAPQRRPLRTAVVVALLVAFLWAALTSWLLRPETSAIAGIEPRIDALGERVARQLAERRASEAEAQAQVPPPQTPIEEAPTPAPEAETPPAGDAEPGRPALPRTLTTTTVRRRFDRLAPAMAKCRERYSGGLSTEHSLKVSVVIDGATGTIKEIADLNGGALAPMGACALEAIKRTKLPAAQRDTTLTHEFVF